MSGSPPDDAKMEDLTLEKVLKKDSDHMTGEERTPFVKSLGESASKVHIAQHKSTKKKFSPENCCSTKNVKSFME